ncbi:hypothetical protein CEXT_302161, partial [Caerostris extrusa]
MKAPNYSLRTLDWGHRLKDRGVESENS